MFGLPLHPLIVHAAVILVPLGALGAVLVVLFAGVRTRYAGLTVLVGALGAASAFAAMLTGPLLAEALGMTGSQAIARHQTLGSWTPWVALLQAVALPVFLRLRTIRDAEGNGPGVASRVAGGVTIAAALAAFVLVSLTGHAGAEAVWG